MNLQPRITDTGLRYWSGSIFITFYPFVLPLRRADIIQKLGCELAEGADLLQKMMELSVPHGTEEEKARAFLELPEVLWVGLDEL